MWTWACLNVCGRDLCSCMVTYARIYVIYFFLSTAHLVEQAALWIRWKHVKIADVWTWRSCNTVSNPITAREGKRWCGRDVFLVKWYLLRHQLESSCLFSLSKECQTLSWTLLSHNNTHNVYTRSFHNTKQQPRASRLLLKLPLSAFLFCFVKQVLVRSQEHKYSHKS